MNRWPYERMSFERYRELQHGPDPQELTEKEIEAGWFWDNETDGLLAHKSWPICNEKEK